MYSRLQPGAVVLAHPRADAPLRACRILRVRDVASSVVLAEEVHESETGYAVVVVPIKDIRLVGEEVELREDERR